MRRHNPFDEVTLAAQVRSQRRHAWDIENDFPWKQGIDYAKPLLPLDNDAIAFPGASREQRLVISQLLGLLINATISEMESVIHKLRDAAWSRALDAYPVNPEMRELGELFFEEEQKHSVAFSRYNQIFCEGLGLDPLILDEILPKVWGSRFLKAIVENARDGGSAFWWAVATVEEVSIEVYKEIRPCRDAVEPLYHMVHLRHLEEESRHRNYAFLMLEVCRRGRRSLLRKVLSRADLVVAQAHTAAWLLNELHKLLELKRFQGEHPFFDIAITCVPLFHQLSFRERMRKLFVTAPYLSVMLNTRHHALTMDTAQAAGVLSFPFPEPAVAATLFESHHVRPS